VWSLVWIYSEFLSDFSGAAGHHDRRAFFIATHARYRLVRDMPVGATPTWQRKEESLLGVHPSEQSLCSNLTTQPGSMDRADVKTSLRSIACVLPCKCHATQRTAWLREFRNICAARICSEIRPRSWKMGQCPTSWHSLPLAPERRIHMPAPTPPRQSEQCQHHSSLQCLPQTAL